VRILGFINWAASVVITFMLFEKLLIVKLFLFVIEKVKSPLGSVVVGLTQPFILNSSNSLACTSITDPKFSVT